MLSVYAERVYPYNIMEDYSDIVQMQARLSYLTNQIEQMQWELARLSREAQLSNSSITAVRKYLLNSDAQTQTHRLLSSLVTQSESQQSDVEELVKTVKKLSRTQFKANALDESKEQQMAETIALLQELATKREDIRTAQQQEERERITELQLQARAEVAAAFLPVLDGIEMALAHQVSLPEPPPPPQEDVVMPQSEPSSGFLKRLFHPGEKHHVAVPQPPQPRDDTTQTLEAMHTAMQRWVYGLEIVRDRFLSLLEHEEIMPIPDVGATFDPHLHVAVDTEKRDDLPENTIVSVLRKGYTHQNRVLRYAEVIVARSPEVRSPEEEEVDEYERLDEDTKEPQNPKPSVNQEDVEVEESESII
jgi:molecular chaperone GrpE (heat shock protein)